VGEAHNGRRIRIKLRGDPIEGRKCHRLQVLNDVFGYLLLGKRELVIVAPQLLDQTSRSEGAELGLTDGHMAPRSGSSVRPGNRDLMTCRSPAAGSPHSSTI